ncbi:ABC transporter substrate-binding protein [Marivirga arenosa]|uniref:ABC transporter substrate-binding protein n=1 Tax=Marivirga arenosa TaxID=3059076 RepID=A0AA51ZWU5_9BACT|nr:ABC transporter substrate-binding protein [Marivirga sp. BKB1-2]WNB18193.1 ABC transporter substrate-binding protein [Marivirga sp. BKB1-2]
MKIRISLFILLMSLFSCESNKQIQQQTKGKELTEYSQTLSIEEFQDYYQVKVKKPSSKDFFNYVLYKNEKPSIEADAAIKIPIKKIACLSTSHLPSIEAIGHSESVIGFPNLDLIYSKQFRKLSEKGNLQDIGQKNGINIEKTISLKPDVITAYAFGGNYEQLKPLQKAGISVIVNTDYLENTPLGRAEWLKLNSILFDEYQKGDSIFNHIKQEYIAAKSLSENIKNKPSVMTGIMYGDIWYMPGGNSYVAKFIEDAAGNYLWKENNETGSLELSFESVLNIAQSADIWIGAASLTSLKKLENTNENYALFEAFQNEQVFSYTKRVTESGANDFLESGYMRADWVLKDYIKLMHPEVLKDTATVYFEKLNP